jgi:hypothetical protein
MRAQFGSPGSGPGQLDYPVGIRLLTDGSGVVVADSNNNRVCVFALSGEFLAVAGCTEQGLRNPFDVLESASGHSFVVANHEGHNLVKLSRDDSEWEVLEDEDEDEDEDDPDMPVALAALPDGGLVVRKIGNYKLHMFRGQQLRHEWVAACVTITARNERKLNGT